MFIILDFEGCHTILLTLLSNICSIQVPNIVSMWHTMCMWRAYEQSNSLQLLYKPPNTVAQSTFVHSYISMMKWLVAKWIVRVVCRLCSVQFNYVCPCLQDVGDGERLQMACIAIFLAFHTIYTHIGGSRCLHIENVAPDSYHWMPKERSGGIKT